MQTSKNDLLAQNLVIALKETTTSGDLFVGPVNQYQVETRRPSTMASVS